MRIFLDTNVLASALMGRGLCRDLLDRAIIEHTILLGAPVREELHRILTGKFRVPPDLWSQLAMRLADFEQVPGTTAIPKTPIPDPDDIPILACAIAAKAEAFVTGDKALLDLTAVGGVPILSPRQFWLTLTGLK